MIKRTQLIVGAALLSLAAGAAQAQRIEPRAPSVEAKSEAKSAEAAKVDASTAEIPQPPAVASPAPLETEVRVIDDLSQSRVRAAIDSARGSQPAAIAEPPAQTGQ